MCVQVASRGCHPGLPLQPDCRHRQLTRFDPAVYLCRKQMKAMRDCMLQVARPWERMARCFVFSALRPSGGYLALCCKLCRRHLVHARKHLGSGMSPGVIGCSRGAQSRVAGDLNHWIAHSDPPRKEMSCLRPCCGLNEIISLAVCELSAQSLEWLLCEFRSIEVTL